MQHCQIAADKFNQLVSSFIADLSSLFRCLALYPGGELVGK
ncbi:MAG: hypothetical protein ACD_39C00604G0001, partial [uncultured bacterium]